jgi:hypothetical protein
MTHKQLVKATAEAFGFKPIKSIAGKQHAYQRPDTMEWVTNNTMSRIVEALQSAQSTGFYGSQAMAGLSLDEAHANWKKYNEPFKHGR